MRTFRGKIVARIIALILPFLLMWAQIAPTVANANEIERHRVHLHQRSMLRPGLTDSPSPALLQKIAARHKIASPKLVSDVMPLSSAQMKNTYGRGVFRSPYYCGTLPWQKSFRDVNLANGNLFKNFTDLQVSPGRGAGLTLNRTYNSNDATIGPFGVGWTHAYNIQLDESAQVVLASGDSNADSNPDDVPRTDFFGAKHTYHRDADGLYSPPPYMYDQMSSDYGAFLAGKSIQVIDDTDFGKDGTTKHYSNEVTNADGTSGDQRYCDYIQDRHGNRTNLTYGQTITQADGSSRNLLTKVTDPDGRSIVFTWTNLNASVPSQPAWRITQVAGPFDPSGNAISGVTETVAYGYYTSASDPNVVNDLYNLKTVTIDPSGLDRVTTYTYIGASGQYYANNGTTQTGSENGLLASVTDTLGRTTSYAYTLTACDRFSETAPTNTGSVWVSSVTLPDGQTSSGTNQTITWNILDEYAIPPGDTVPGEYSWNNIYSYPGELTGTGITFVTEGGEQVTHGSYAGNDPNFNDKVTFQIGFEVDNDAGLRSAEWRGPDTASWLGEGVTFDNNNNVVTKSTQGLNSLVNADNWTYGPSGDMLTHSVSGFSATETYTYYNADKYFQKATETDMDGHTTTYDYYTNTDSNPGNCGEVKQVQDPGYADSSSPSYQKKYTYTYNAYGQKASETNLNGVMTNYTYGDGSNASYPGDLGNLTQVVQDSGSGHLNRTTLMHYDWAGHVLSATDPKGNVTSTAYNILGQPNAVQSFAAANASTPAETISYGYDSGGRTLNVTDNRGTTSMAYVPNSDWVQSVTDPVTGAISYTYSMWGERTSMTLPGGGTWNYAYTDSGSSTQYANDYFYPYPANDPYSATEPYLPSSPGLWTFTKDGDFDSLALQLREITDDQGRRIDLSYDPVDSKYNGYTYDQVYNMSGSETMDCQSAMQYDSTQSLGSGGPYKTHWWLTQLTNMLNGTNANGRILQQSNYTYDTAGLRTSYMTSSQGLNADGTAGAITSRTENYTYDDLSRLSTVNYGDGETQNYSFDPMGNRLGLSDVKSSGTTNTSYSYDAANRLTTVGSTAVTFDADGNTLTDQAGRHFTWDSENRMTSCTLSNGQVTTFTYGADGLRRSMTVTQGSSSLTTYYVYDGTMMIREMQVINAQLTPSATYFQGAQGPAYRRNDLTGSIPHWYVYNGLGSVVGEVDPAGNYIASQEYDVYGNVRTSTQAGTFDTRQGYVGGLGHQTDPETGGLIYMQARYYDPSTGRFASQDPKGNGENWFVYVGNNPVNNIDPDGKKLSTVGQWLLWGGVAIAITGVILIALTNPITAALVFDTFAAFLGSTVIATLSETALATVFTNLAVWAVANAEACELLGNLMTVIGILTTALSAECDETDDSNSSGKEHDFNEAGI